MYPKTFNVLFLCTGNSARSIMAEAVMNSISGGRFKAFSAGSHPTGQVHPMVIDLLEQNHFPTEGLRSKLWNEFAAPGAPALDFVFTVCDKAASEMCPHWPGQPITAHWGVEDPVAAGGSEDARRRAFYTAFLYLSNRIRIFSCLPFDKLDSFALQREVDSIGKARPT